MKLAPPATHDFSDMLALRRHILDSPVAVALREYFGTVPLYLRPHDRLAGSISETPGAMPVFVELGIAENGIYVGENPGRRGYLRGRVPPKMLRHWEHRDLVVRVAGFSEFFVNLTRDIQDGVIARAEHSL